MATARHGYPLEFVLGLTIEGLNRLLGLARRVRNGDTQELAVAVRNAHHADSAAWEQFTDAYSEEDPVELEQKKINQGVKGLAKMFGGK